MFSQRSNVISIHQMRASCQLQSEFESGAIGRLDFFPVAIESSNFVIRQTRDREFVFLMTESVKAVVGARADPEQFYLECIV